MSLHMPTKIEIEVPDNITSKSDLVKFLKSETDKEVERLAKEREAMDYLAKLHQLASKETGRSFQNTQDLVEALLPFCSARFRGRLENGESRRGKRTRLTPEVIAEIKELKKQGMTNVAIARRIGCSNITVAKALGK